MTEQDKTEWLRRKAMLFRFLDFLRRSKMRNDFWGDDDDYQIEVDNTLDQIVNINRLLRESNIL